MRSNNRTGRATPLVLALLLVPLRTFAVSPAAKLFTITGSPPLEAIAVDTLSPTNAKQTRFEGGATLELGGATPVALRATLQIKHQKGTYVFKSSSPAFPKFSGTIITRGTPEVVRSVALTLTRRRNDKVKVTRARGTTVTPVISPPTTTTIAAGTSTTTSSSSTSSSITSTTRASTSTPSTSTSTTLHTPTTTSTSTSVTTSTARSTSTTTSVPATTSTTLPCVATSGCFCDTGDGTIHDTCTGLQWEKKTTTGDLHDAGNGYSWAGCCSGDCTSIGNYCQPNAAAAGTCAAHADGGAAGCTTCTSGLCDVDPDGNGATTTVWDWLNQVNAANFAGHADWRLPSEGGRSKPPTGAEELETILEPRCSAGPCIDPIFGLTETDPSFPVPYASSSDSGAYPRYAWYVDFAGGFVRSGAKQDVYATRLVRGRSTPCAGDRTSCGGTCVDTSTDPNNCGSCGNSCSAGVQCHGGVCGECTAERPCVSGCFTDTGDGTIHDTCTGLQWEKKVDLGSGASPTDLRDVHNFYLWAGCCNGDCSVPSSYCQPDAAASATCASEAGAGAVGCATCSTGTCDTEQTPIYSGLTTVWKWLDQLNAANFAGHDDWRLPSEAGCNACRTDHVCCAPDELDTIQLARRDCYASPCIDPIFGPTDSFIYWSASTSTVEPASAWNVYFDYDSTSEHTDEPFSGFVRAVRGGSPTTSITTTTTTSSSTTTSLAPCFQDTGDGTIHDVCTGLQWEKKTDAAGLHYMFDEYTWAGCCDGDCSAAANYCQPNAAAAATCAAQSDGGALGCSTCTHGTCNVDPNGSLATTTVWDWLNQVNAANFAGHNDWAVPSEGGRNAPFTGFQELRSVLHLPCSPGSCIDEILGFDPAGERDPYWSSSSDARYPRSAWYVDLGAGNVGVDTKDMSYPAVAVRGRSNTCTGGRTSCGGACVDTSSDPNNCGTCGHACPAGATCHGGVCGACAPATPCVSGCFRDVGDGTIHDTCTGLQWEKKTGLGGAGNPADLHDVANTYWWVGCCNSDCTSPANFCQPNATATATCAAHADGEVAGCDTCADGPCDVDPFQEGVVTTVWDWLAQLNAASFAGHSDWRLPSEDGCNACWSYPDSCAACSPHELETILQAPYKCTGYPCVDPIFDPAQPGEYWSSSGFPGYLRLAWTVNFTSGRLLANGKLGAHSVRAVRGGP